MKTFLTTTALVLALSGVAAAETRPLSGFTSVSASAGTQVEVATGQGFAVDVTGPDAARITTRVVGNELRISRETHWGWGRGPNAVVHVTMPRVEGLEASSGAHLRAASLQADQLSLDASSGGGLTVAGACHAVIADASSGATLNAARLQCERGSVDASSGARAEVNVTGTLNVDASSGGNVYASGAPQMGDISLSSGGALHRR
jgi:hypothetical protein